MVIAFSLFIVIKLMNKAAKLSKKKEEEQPAAPTADQALLIEIRDLLKNK
jgi:large conductance mechanosensitive channel